MRLKEKKLNYKGRIRGNTGVCFRKVKLYTKKFRVWKYKVKAPRHGSFYDGERELLRLALFR